MSLRTIRGSVLIWILGLACFFCLVQNRPLRANTCPVWSTNHQAPKPLLFWRPNNRLKGNMTTGGSEELSVFVGCFHLVIQGNRYHKSMLPRVHLTDFRLFPFAWREDDFLFSHIRFPLRFVQAMAAYLNGNLLDGKWIVGLIGCAKPNIDFVRFIFNSAKNKCVLTLALSDLHFNPLLHSSRLNVSLSFNGPPCAPEQHYLKCANYHQSQGECPRPPVVDVLQDRGVILDDGDLQRRAGRYSGWLLLFILCTVFPPIWIGGYGLSYATDERRWWGWLLVALALLMVLTGVLSGGLRALPWDWHKRLREPEKCYYCDNRQSFQHNSAIVPQKHLDTI